tara:strand:+ start:379 stop:522 length:144 start_codon:yes stop_codon:yes gene_type:complete
MLTKVSTYIKRSIRFVGVFDNYNLYSADDGVKQVVSFFGLLHYFIHS